MNIQQAIDWQKKARLFVSLAARPGRTGETFYNTLFQYHGINAEYVACECKDLAVDMDFARKYCAGVSVTMPFKIEVGQFVDAWECRPGPVNTIKVKQGRFIAYNCDYRGLEDTITDVKGKTITILGDGAMAENVKLLAEYKGANVNQYSRRAGNWDQRHQASDIVVNCTSIGMGTEESPLDHVNDVSTVVDCVIGNTALLKMARNSGHKAISGAEIYIAQFKHQFKVYTGMDADAAVVSRVAKEFFSYV